jgi:hypothetical protein
MRSGLPDVDSAEPERHRQTAAEPVRLAAHSGLFKLGPRALGFLVCEHKRRQLHNHYARVFARPHVVNPQALFGRRSRTRARLGNRALWPRRRCVEGTAAAAERRWRRRSGPGTSRRIRCSRDRPCAPTHTSTPVPPRSTHSGTRREQRMPHNARRFALSPSGLQMSGKYARIQGCK